MEKVERFADWISSAAMWVAIIVGTLMMLHVTADVFARNVLNAPLFGTIEIVSNYYMVAVSYLPLAWIVKHEGHIFVELFTRNLSAGVLLRLDTYVGVITLVYVAIITWKTLESAIEQTQIREQTESALGFISIWQSRWFVVIGFGCFALQLVAQVVLGFARLSNKTEANAS
ncbi:MAG: TRAP transporter small permease [Hyphomicrobiales bacterium]|nr:TRAP transporter small permease [Hyphomicrobiales bacterium]